MQADKAEILRKKWGNKPCNHPDLDKEYILSAQTGDYICTTCGKVFFSREEAEQDRKNISK